MGPNGSDALSGSSPEVPAVLISIDKSLESIRSQEKGPATCAPSRFATISISATDTRKRNYLAK